MSLKVSKAMIKPYNLSEMAKLYGIDYRTFKRWIKPYSKRIGKINGRFFSIEQVKTIFKYLGTPTL